METFHTEKEFTLHKGDCLEVMRSMPDNSVDSIPTDPPYGIGFMGKAWDSFSTLQDRLQTHLRKDTVPHGAKARTKGGSCSAAEIAGKYDRSTPANVKFQAWTEAWAREAFRILKPGGHLLVFASTRTYHRMASGVEDAGFEIRDQIGWAFGSGFPKSLDVSKAIDGADKIGTVRERSLKFTAFMRSTGITGREVNEATNSSMASHYLTAKEQPEVATEDMFSKLRPILAARGVVVPDEIEQLIAWRTVESENMKRRRVVRTEEMIDMTKLRPVPLAAQGLADSPTRIVNITEAHTENAKRWEGWGTALKPAWEPIVVARKPLEGSVADNVLKYGVGALNIDAGRINGRWPANLCHDGSAEVMGCFPAEAGAFAPVRGTEPSTHAFGQNGIYSPMARTEGAFYDDEGSAARFFYCAKCSTEDREEGLEELAARTCERSGGAQNAEARGEDYDAAQTIGLNKVMTRRNIHPTVKPTALMQWVCRLITPPGGLVFDPFLGSGSTGKAAMLERFRFIGCDVDEDGHYLPIARARIAYALTHRDRWTEIHAAETPTPDTPGQSMLSL